MIEISTKKIEIGQHVLIDGVEYVAEEDVGSCKSCDMKGCGYCYLIPCSNGLNLKRVKPESTYRPYKDTDEMIADWKERFVAKDWPSHSMPLIWLMCGETRSFVTDYLPDSVYACSTSLTMQDIYEDYTYLDGSPCGMKED